MDRHLGLAWCILHHSLNLISETFKYVVTTEKHLWWCMDRHLGLAWCKDHRRRLWKTEPCWSSVNEDQRGVFVLAVASFSAAAPLCKDNFQMTIPSPALAKTLAECLCFDNPCTEFELTCVVLTSTLIPYC